MSSGRHPIVRMIKTASNLVAVVLVSPAALMCWAEDRWHSGAEGIFGLWTHVFAVLPGMPGLYLAARILQPHASQLQPDKLD